MPRGNEHERTCCACTIKLMCFQTNLVHSNDGAICRKEAWCISFFLIPAASTTHCAPQVKLTYVRLSAYFFPSPIKYLRDVCFKFPIRVTKTPNKFLIQANNNQLQSLYAYSVLLFINYVSLKECFHL